MGLHVAIPIAIALACFGSPLRSAAATWQINGAGSVAESDQTDLVLPGDAMSFALLFDPLESDLVPADSSLGLYPSLGFAIAVATPPLGRRRFACLESGIQVTDAATPGEFDGVVFEGFGCLDDLGNVLPEVFVQFSDSSQTALPDDALRPERFDVALYDFHQGRVKGCRALPCDPVAAFDFVFSFDVETLAVPEPGLSSGLAVAWVLVLALGAKARNRHPAC